MKLTEDESSKNIFMVYLNTSNQPKTNMKEVKTGGKCKK
jgi:hypothetical protein